MAKRKSPCKDPHHVKQSGTQRCATCMNARQRIRRALKHAANGEMLIMPAGMTAHQAGALRMWEQRRQKYGSSGSSPEARPRLVEVGSTLAQRRKRRTMCVNGHALTAANVLPSKHGRRCRICQAHRKERRRQRKQGPDYRPTWAETQHGRVNIAVHDTWAQRAGSELWRTMLASHPDVGGTKAKFRDARRRWLKFEAQEKVWYTAAGVPMPNFKRGLTAVATLVAKYKIVNETNT